MSSLRARASTISDDDHHVKSAVHHDDNTTEKSTNAPNALNANVNPNADPVDSNVILVDWEQGDPANPQNWSNAKKWRTTLLLCVMCLFIGLSTAGYSAGISKMVVELHTSVEIGQVGMFVFNGSFAIVPMFFGPLSEFIGRNPIYLISYALFIVFFIPLALAQNVATFIICRLLSGCFGATGTTIIPGTLADIWNTEERGLPVACFSFVAVFGTVAPPLYTGFINETIGWRWIEWIQLISNGALIIIEVAFLRETRGSMLLTQKAKKMRKETGDQRYKSPEELHKLPFKSLLKASTTRAFYLLFTEPVVFFFSLWLAFAWAIIFLFFEVIGLTFQGNHHWSQGIAGLPYISSIIGCFLAFFASLHQNRIYTRATLNNGGVPIPEVRLYYARLGAILLPISLYWFSFTQFSSVHWIVPTLALCPMVFAIYLIFDSVQNYLTDAYGEYAASALSAQGFVRNMLAASFPLFSRQMFVNMHYQYAGLLLSLFGTVMIPLPFILMKYGERIREKSPYCVAKAELEQMHEKEEKVHHNSGTGNQVTNQIPL